MIQARSTRSIDVDEDQSGGLRILRDLLGELFKDQSDSPAPIVLSRLNGNHPPRGTASEPIVGVKKGVVFAAEKFVESAARHLRAADHVANFEGFVALLSDNVNEGTVDTR